MRAFTTFLMLFFIVFAINSCGNNSSRNSLSGQEENFDEFLIKFDNDSIFQMKRIEFPLEVQAYDDYSDYEGFETRYLEKEEWEFQKGELTVRKIISEKNIVNENYIELHTQVSDTDIYVIYCFRKINGKWHLVKAIDQSL